MFRRLVLLVFVILPLTTAATAQQWDPNDDTFDPAIQSVVIGNRSWLGDPSPFVFQSLKRTGYTHVNATNYEGMAPSVVVSLMVPIVPGETKALGASLFFDRKRAVAMQSLLKAALKEREEGSKERPPIKLETSLDQADWKLVTAEEEGQRIFALENKIEEKTDRYRFSVNAMKKLLGAFEHAIANLQAKK
ncbi:MAG: hypothetical protein AAFU85_17705 [Planctomycetota bacterium]